MKTNNNFFTHIRKWGSFSKFDEPPRFYKQKINLTGKRIIPYDELKEIKRENNLNEYVPHFFISDAKQICFAENPDKHSDILSKCFAVCSTDFSVFSNVYSEFNNAVILLNRLVASKWQQSDRYVILTLSWGNEDTYKTAFSNIEKGSIVAISSEGISDRECFKKGFIYMSNLICPSKICWKGSIPEWVQKEYDLDDIIKIRGRFDRQLFQNENSKQLLLFN